MRISLTAARGLELEVSRTSYAVEPRDLAIAGTLAGLTLASRWPLVGGYFYQWDSVNFALALGKFNVAIGQPQIPGYFLYVLLGRFVHAFVGDPKWALTSISIAASAMSVLAIVKLGGVLFDKRVGTIAAVGLATSPLFWFYGELALPHALDAFMVMVAVWWFHEIRQGQTWLAVPAAAWLAIAGGLRPQTEVFLLPLALYAGIRLSWKQRILSAGLLLLVNLLWLVPMLALSGGLQKYWSVASAYANSFNQATSVFQGAGVAGLEHNVLKLVMYTAYGLGAFAFGAGLAILVWIGQGRWHQSPRAVFSDERTRFLLIWILPSLAYYSLIHMGQQGLVFVFLPALLIVLAAILSHAVRLPTMRIGLVSSCVIINVLSFLFLPTFPFKTSRVKLLTWDTIRQNDAFLGERVEAVRDNFNPQDSLIVSSGWRFVQYYLPTYRYIPYMLGGRWDASEGQPVLTSTQRATFEQEGLTPDPAGKIDLILFEPSLSRFSRMSNPPLALPIPGGGSLTYYQVDPKSAFVFGPDGFRDEIVSGGQ